MNFDGQHVLPHQQGLGRQQNRAAVDGIAHRRGGERIVSHFPFGHAEPVDLLSVEIEHGPVVDDVPQPQFGL